MRNPAVNPRSAIGFTVKSGWAAAVLVIGPPTSPQIVESVRIELSDPALPVSRQPYHEGFATARAQGPELTRLLASVKRFGRQSVTRFIRHCERAHPLSGAGVVVGSTIDPERIGNEHIRIHALEGKLFRSVVDDAVVRCGLKPWLWRERDLYAAGCRGLERQESELRSTLGSLGRGIDGPWRAEQKAAALAAWLVIATAAAGQR